MSRYHTVTVDVDANDVLAELTDEELFEEMDARGKGPGIAATTEDLERIRFMLVRGEHQNALALVDNIIQSGRSRGEDINNTYQTIKKGTHPFLTMRTADA